MSSSPHIVIIGGGVAGLAIGWKLAKRGAQVTLCEKGSVGRGTSWQAAGMLAPDAEIGFEEPELHELSLKSRQQWPDFAESLEEESGIDLDFRRDGTLLVADDPDSAAKLRRNFDFQREQGCRVEWLTGDEALEREPFLAPKLSAAVYALDDYQVENRQLVRALQTALEAAGGTIHERTEVTAVFPDKTNPRVETAGGESFTGDIVVLAAGTASSKISGVMEDMPPIRPVKGQMIELEMRRPFDLRHVVRGPDAYVVPKTNGRLLIGATSEERGFDTEVTGGGLLDLLEGAWEVVPGIHDLPFKEAWAGLRPASLDHKPLLGPGPEPRVFYATGLFRHGILLTPITADLVSNSILDRETSKMMQPFSPSRFLER